MSDERASVKMSVHGIGGGVQDLSISFDDLAPEVITPQLRHALLNAMGLVTSALLEASKAAPPGRGLPPQSNVEVGAVAHSSAARNSTAPLADKAE